MTSSCQGPQPWQEPWIVWLLRIAGAVMLLAFFAMVMPTSWMQDIHRWLGLGELAADAITEYLTRSRSALDGFQGGLCLVLSTDVRRHRRVVWYVAAMGVVLGACLVGIDVYAGMPTWWILGEGPPIIGLGAVMLWLLRGVPDAD
jgi:hypothetical protein